MSTLAQIAMENLCLKMQFFRAIAKRPTEALVIALEKKHF